VSDDAGVKDLEDRKAICERAAAVAGVIAGGNALAQLLPWIVTVVAGGIMLVALLAAWLFSVEIRRARQRQHEREQTTAQSARRCAVDVALRTPVGIVADLELERLGVDPVDPRVLAHALKVDGDQLAYVRRDVDARLRAHLARARDSDGPTLVCLHGPSKAGKSRSMLHALHGELPDALLVAPDRTRMNLQTIIDQRELQRLAEGGNRTVVLWLDDLEGFVRLQNTGVDHRLLEDLKRNVPGLVVAATAGGRGVRAHADSERVQLQQPLTDLLAHAVREPLLAGLVSSDELAALREVVPDDLFDEAINGLGELAVAGRELIDILVNESHPRVSAGQPCPHGAALAWGAITAVRLGLTDPLNEDMLRKLFGCYTTSVSDEAFRVALDWATTPLYARVALLRSDDGLVSPYDYVVQHAPPREASAERCAWAHLLDSSPAEALFQLGSTAYVLNRLDDADAAYRRADERGLAAAATNLGALLQERGELAEAEAAYRRADERGDEMGASNLGVLLKQRGELDAAEAAYRRADERGFAIGASNLGSLLKQRGELAEAEAAFRRADERGDETGAYGLGVLLKERGELAEAEAAYRRADERGGADGAFNLGVLLQERSEFAEAEAAYRRADERSDAAGASNLGILLQQRGELAEAEAAYRRADQRGDPTGASNLGVLLQQRGELAEAEAAYRRADQRGHSEPGWV
jgi:Flp pilus assembly protein TadD